MSEREPRGQDEIDPYWNHDVVIGDGLIQNKPYTIRMRIHTGLESYRGKEELYPLEHRTGEMDYVMGKPYILYPSITITLSTYDAPTPEGAIGEVVSSEWEGMRHEDIGHGQAWFYRQDRVLVLWECYLHDWVRQGHDTPADDETLKTVWQGFEGWLVERFHPERIVTPSWEPIYEAQEGAWPEFLHYLGYQPFNKQAFLKEVERP